MITILGATGKVGGAAARRLRQLGHAVRAVVRDPARAGELAALGCELARAEIQDRGALQAALSGSDAVLVLCPLSPRMVDPRAECLRLSESIGRALEGARPDHVIAISDYGAHLERGTGVTLILRDFEQQLDALSLSVSHLRSAEHMQNWQRQRRTAEQSGVLPTLHLPATRAFPTVSAYDVGTVAGELLARASAGERPARVLHVEGPQRYAASDVARVFAERFGRDVSPHELPRDEWLAALGRGGVGPAYAELICELQDAHNRGLIDVEPGGSILRGTTQLAQALA